MQVGEPALPAAVSPLRAEHDEIVRPHRLHLAPGLAAPAGRVRGRGVLHDDALVSGAEGFVQDALSLRGVGGEEPGHLELRRDLGEPPRSLLERHVEQVFAVDVEEVEEEGRDSLRRGLAVDLRHGVLERRRAVVAHPERLAVEHRLLQREAERGRHGRRHRVCDVVEVAGEDAHLRAAAMHLDADPVELPLHRGALEARDGAGHRLGRRGEHRQDRAEDLEADGAQSFLAARERDLGGARQVARHHQRAPCRLGRDARRLGDRLRNEGGQRSLPQLAGEETLDEVGFRRGRAAEQPDEERLAPRRRSAARRPLDLDDREVEIPDRERGLPGRRLLERVDRRVAHADPALPREAGEEPRRDRRLACVEPAQQVGEDGDLPGARARRGDVVRGGDEVGE